MRSARYMHCICMEWHTTRWQYTYWPIAYMYIIYNYITYRPAYTHILSMHNCTYTLHLFTHTHTHTRTISRVQLYILFKWLYIINIVLQKKMSGRLGLTFLKFSLNFVLFPTGLGFYNSKTFIWGRIRKTAPRYSHVHTYLAYTCLYPYLIAFAVFLIVSSHLICVLGRTEAEAGPSRGPAAAAVIATDSMKRRGNRCSNESIVSSRP